MFPPKIRPRTVRLHPVRPDVAARLRHFHRPRRGAGGPLPLPVGLGLADGVACRLSGRAGGGTVHTQGGGLADAAGLMRLGQALAACLCFKAKTAIYAR